MPPGPPGLDALEVLYRETRYLSLEAGRVVAYWGYIMWAGAPASITSTYMNVPPLVFRFSSRRELQSILFS